MKLISTLLILLTSCTISRLTTDELVNWQVEKDTTAECRRSIIHMSPSRSLEKRYLGCNANDESPLQIHIQSRATPQQYGLRKN